MALKPSQKSFIRDKVVKLGSIEKVRIDYKRDDLVCEFARAHAEKIFGEKTKIRRRKYWKD